MNEDQQQASRLLFADLVLDTGKHEVSRGGEIIDLPKLSYQLIRVLVRAAPNVVSHDEIINRVWSGRVVSPETVTQRVKLLRSALGDDAHDPRFVGVVRGEGYRLLVDVEDLPPDESSLTRDLVAELGRRRVLQIALIYAAVAWSITEVVSFLLDALPVFPQWSKALVAILFIVGFPVAMFLAWRFDIGPGGIKRTQAASTEGQLTIVAALLLLVGATASLFYQPIALIYAAVAWSITEVVSFLLDALPVFPQWSKALVAILFIVGFPVAMFLAWRFDIGPGGIKRTQAASTEGQLTIVAALLLLVGATASLFYLIYPSVLEQRTALREAPAATKLRNKIARRC